MLILLNLQKELINCNGKADIFILPSNLEIFYAALKDRLVLVTSDVLVQVLAAEQRGVEIYQIDFDEDDNVIEVTIDKKDGDVNLGDRNTSGPADNLAFDAACRGLGHGRCADKHREHQMKVSSSL